MRPIKISFIFTIFVAFHTVSGGDMFTALIELKNALVAEDFVASNLKKYIKEERDRIKKLEEIAKNLEEHSKEALDNPIKHLANPVNAYLIVKRFAIDWFSVVEQYISSKKSQEFLSSLTDMTIRFPDAEDFTGSALALLRLQDVYALNTSEIASGNIKGVLKSPDMNADDCFQLGLVAYNRDDFYHATLWMLEAARKDSLETIKTSDRVKILDYLTFALYKQGNPQLAYNYTKELVALEPNFERFKANLDYFETQLLTNTTEEVFQNSRILTGNMFAPDYDMYEKLCRGEETHFYQFKNKLTCQYKRHTPHFFIKPLKEEVLYLDPRIVVYHQVLGDKEVEKIKELASPMLERSGVFQLDPNQNAYPEYRTSKTAWLSDSMDPIISRMTHRTTALANLTADTVEYFQVLNYGIAGQYEPHYDFARPNEENTFEEWRGNRIATVIYYVSDVEAGGATVFNNLGVRVMPEKGACAVWYNLHRNGMGDYRTKHAGCPVLSGIKWVCNKWYHIKGQEFTRPCSIEQF